MDNHRIALEAFPPDHKDWRFPHFQRVKASGHDHSLEEFGSAVGENRDVVLSSEYFSAAGPDLTRGFLEARGVAPGDVRVVVVIRRQDAFLASAFNQEVKRTGRSRPFAWDPQNAVSWDWYKRISRWADVFDDSAINVLVYERLAHDAAPRGLVQGLAQACGIELASPEDGSDRETGANRSLSAPLLRFQMRANAVTALGETEWLVDRALERGGSYERFCIPAPLAREIVDYYRESNEAVAARFLGNEVPIFPDQVDGDPDQVSLDEDTHALTSLLALLAAEIGRTRNTCSS
ncbi:hypothetical protein [Nocardioides immobilis]|nr:hypothetical protein [Nocardioides immobilis]